MMETEMVGVIILVGAIFVLLVAPIALSIYDNAYLIPIADDKANTYCQIRGFDQYKSYSRVGLFSKDPVAIKCEYSERYTDLGIHANK